MTDKIDITMNVGTVETGGTVIGVQHNYPPPARPFLALHTLRAPLRDFTGRTDDIRNLVAHLGRDGGTAAITGIRGMGGIGKTELALMVACALTDHYPDVQLMLELQPGAVPVAPEAVLGSVIHALQPDLHLPDELADLQGVYRAALAGKRGLLLLDNAVGPEQVRPLVPAPAGWAVLVTSRARFPLPGARLHDLELLPLVDAVALLRRVLTDGGRHDLAEEGMFPLAERCGRLPLALRLAAGFLSTYRDWTLPDYLAALDRARLAHLTAPGEAPVQAVLGLSSTRLREHDAVLAGRWEQLAVFPAAFDRAAAAAVWGELGDPPSENVDAWPKLAPLDEEGTRQALSALVQQSLLDYAPASETYSLHDLMRECILAAPAVAQDEARLRHAWHYLRLGREAEDRHQQGGQDAAAGLQQFERIWPHLDMAWAWLRGRTDESARRWVNAYPLGLLERACQGFYLTAEYRQADVRYREALELAIALDANPRRIAQLYRFLALTVYGMGHNQECLGYLEQGLAVLRQHEIPTERLTIELEADRISALDDLGESDYQESVLAYTSLLDDAATLDPTVAAKAMTAMIYNYRANALSNVDRQLEAEADYQRAVELYEEVGDWRRASTGLLNLATQALWRSCPDDADEPLARGTAYSERVGDADNLNWAKALRGNMLLMRDRAAESEKLLLEAIAEAEERDFGWNLVGMHVDLAAARLALGHAREAWETAQKALYLAERNGDSDQTGWSHQELGRAESALDNHAEAEIHLRKSMEIHSQAGQRQMAACAQGYLGQALHRAGQAQQSLIELKEAIATLEVLQMDRDAELFRKLLREMERE